MVPMPRPPKPSEIVPVTSMVSIKDNSYWENLHQMRMPECYQLAILAIEQGDSPMARVEIDTSTESSSPVLEQAPWDTSNHSETCRNYLLVRDSMLKDLQVLQQQENSRKRERELDTSVEVLSPPKKKSIKERLGIHQDSTSSSISPPAPPSNTPTESLEVNLSMTFTVENDSCKESSVPLVELLSSSSGVDTDSSLAQSISPQDLSRSHGHSINSF